MTLSQACERYRQEIVGHLKAHFGIGDRAEDAAQQAFAQAALHLPEIRQMPEEAVRAWLHATARNAAIDALRKDRRLLYEHDFDRAQAHSPLQAADRLALKEALNGLDDFRRQIVSLRYLQGWTSGEIAERTRTNPSTVRYHLAQAVKELRRRLKEEEA